MGRTKRGRRTYPVYAFDVMRPAFRRAGRMLAPEAWRKLHPAAVHHGVSRLEDADLERTGAGPSPCPGLWISLASIRESAHIGPEVTQVIGVPVLSCLTHQKTRHSQVTPRNCETLFTAARWAGVHPYIHA